MAISEDVDRIVDDASAKVQERFDEAQTYADEAWDLTEGHLQTLQTALRDLKFRTVNDVTVEGPTWVPDLQELLGNEAKPDFADYRVDIENIVNDLDGDLNDIPNDPTLVTIPNVNTPSIPSPNSSVPGYTAPDEPTPFDDTLPVMEPINPVTPPSPVAEETFDRPSIIYPTLPSVPTIAIPAFLATIDIDDINWVIPSMVWSEDAYTSDLSTTIKNKVTDIINNQGVGMSATVQAAYYDKDVERAIQAKEDAIDNAINEWAGRGWDLPGGDIEDKVVVIEHEYLNKRLEVSRDIVVKNFELEYQMLDKAVGHANVLETQLIGFENNRKQRAFDAAKFAAELSIQILNSEIARNNQRIEVFKVEVMQWEAQLKAELAKLELYKGELEGVKAYVDVNESMVKLYQADISAYGSKIEAYKAHVQAKLMEFELEKTKLEKFKALIDAFIAGVNAKTAEYNMYRAKVDGRLAPIQAYEAEMRGYAAMVEGYKVRTQAEVAHMEGKVSQNDGLLKNFAQQIEAVKAKIQARQAGIEGHATLAKSETDMYNAIVAAYGTLGGLVIKQYEADVQAAIAQAEIDIKEQEIESVNYQKVKELYIEGLKSIAQIGAQVVASALTSVSAQASLTASGSATEDFNYSETLDLTEA